MRAIRRNRGQVASSATQCVLLWALALLAGCGGETGNNEPAKTGGSGGAAPMDGGSGGSFSTGGAGSSLNPGGTGGGVLRGEGTGGALYEVAGDNACKDTALYNAIRFAAHGAAQCVIWREGEPPEGVDLTPNPYRMRGAIVLDSAGRIVEVRGDGTLSNLDVYAGGRWPCYADQTLEYACSPLI